MKTIEKISYIICESLVYILGINYFIQSAKYFKEAIINQLHPSILLWRLSKFGIITIALSIIICSIHDYIFNK